MVNIWKDNVFELCCEKTESVRVVGPRYSTIEFWTFKKIRDDTKVSKLSFQLKIKFTMECFRNNLRSDSHIRECYNPLDDCLESTSPIDYPADYKNCGLTQEIKIW